MRSLGEGPKGGGQAWLQHAATPMCGEAERRASKKGERGGEEALQPELIHVILLNPHNFRRWVSEGLCNTPKVARGAGIKRRSL